MGLTARGFVVGFVSCVLLVSCAGMSIRYYGLSQVNYNQGTLVGPNPEDDVPLSKCAPIGNDPQPCIVMFSDDFFALKQDYLDTKQKLKDCQKR